MNERYWFECSVELQKNFERKAVKVHTNGKDAFSQIDGALYWILLYIAHFNTKLTQPADQGKLLLDPLYALGKYGYQLGFKGYPLRYRFRDMKG